MAQYIDKDALVAKIERLYNRAERRVTLEKEGLKAEDTRKYEDGLADAYDIILSFIDSLQQEQPEGLHFIPLNRLIQKIPSKNWNDTVNNYAKKLRDCLVKEGYLKDAKVLQGYISRMNGNNVPMATMDEQEQPEVDLDALVDEAFYKYSSVDGYGQLSASFNRAELYSFIKKIARKEE